MAERDFYIETNSFAAPWCSDTGFVYVSAHTAREALEKAAAAYEHPFGLYAAAAYASADAKNKGEQPLAMWLCNHEAEKQRITKGLGCYSFYGRAPGDFEVDGKRYTVENPKGGRVVEEATNG